MINVTLTNYTGSISTLYSALNSNRTALRSLQLDQSTSMVVPYVIKNREYNKFVEVIDTEFSEIIVTSGPSIAELQLLIDNLTAQLDSAETQVTSLESDLTAANETIDLLASAADTTDLWRPAKLYPRIDQLNFGIYNFFDIPWGSIAVVIRDFFGPEMNQVEFDALQLYETSLNPSTTTNIINGASSVIDRLRSTQTATTVTAAEIDAMTLSQIPGNYRNLILNVTNYRNAVSPVIPNTVPNQFSYILGNGTNTANNFNDFKLLCKKIVARVQSKINSGQPVAGYELLYQPNQTVTSYFDLQYTFLYNQNPI